MKRNASLVGMIGIVTFTANVAAQNTLGELLDAGAKKLSKEEIQSTFNGTHSTGKTATGASGEFEFKADGTYHGVVQTPQGNAGIMGTWTAAAGDKLCVEWTPVGRGASKGGGCGFYYVLAGDYYLSESDSDRSVRVLKRTLKK